MSKGTYEQYMSREVIRIEIELFLVITNESSIESSFIHLYTKIDIYVSKTLYIIRRYDRKISIIYTHAMSRS